MSRRRVVGAVLVALAVIAAGAPAAAEVRDRWEVTLVPPPAFELDSADVYNPLGTVSVRGWDRKEVRIVAEKWARDATMMSRIKVLAGFCQDGSACVKTYVLMADGQKGLPVSMGRIDLTIDIPRHLPLRARTFVGDVEAVGLRRGAALESKSGAIRVRDLHGQVTTRSLRGSQTVTSVQGSVTLDGVAGDLDLVQVQGERLTARTVEGSIRATKIHAQMVRLSTTTGEVWLLDLAVAPGGRYDLGTFEGSIRVRPLAPAGLDIVARHLRGRLHSRLPLTLHKRTPQLTRATLGGGGALLTLTAASDVSLE